MCVHGQACVYIGWLVYVCVAVLYRAVLKQSSQDRSCLLPSLASVLSRLMWGQGALDATCNPSCPVQPFPLGKEDSSQDIGTHWCGAVPESGVQFPTSYLKRPLHEQPHFLPSWLHLLAETSNLQKAFPAAESSSQEQPQQQPE